MPITPPVPGGAALNPNNPQIGSTGTLSEFFQKLNTPLRPQEEVALRERNRQTFDFQDILRLLGFYKTGSGPVVGHYEAGPMKDPVKFGALITAPNVAGDSWVVELTADSMFAPSGIAQQASNIREKDTILLKDAAQTVVRVEEKNMSVTPHQITIRPLDSTVNLTGRVELNSPYAVFANMHAEGTDGPAGLTQRYLKYQNNYQILKDRASETRTSMGTQVYFNPTPGQEGSLFQRDFELMKKRHGMDKASALMFGKTADNITEIVAELGYPVSVSGTEGMISFIEKDGFELSYLPGLYTIQNFYDVTQTFDGEGVLAKDYMVLQGNIIHNQLEQLSADIASNYDAKLIAQSEDGDVHLKYGIKGIQIGGYNFFFKKEEMFSQIRFLGAPGYKYNQYNIFVPLAEYFTPGIEGNPSFMAGYQVKAAPGGQPHENLISYANGMGLGAYPVTDTIDRMKVVITSEMAFHGACPNNYLIQKPE